MKELDGVIERLKQEVMELSKKMAKIDIFMADKEIDYLSKDPYKKSIAELSMQKSSMKEYKSHLLKRIAYLTAAKTEK